MIVNFYKNFSKRINSTKRPTGDATAALDCRLKDATSLHDPVLQVATDDFGYEYAYIPTLQKYYFVKDVVSVAKGLAEYQLSEDTMATYKTDIEETYAHVIYSSSDYDLTIIDPRIVVGVDRRVLTSGGPTSSNQYRIFSSDSSWYILSVFNGVSASSPYGIAFSYAIQESEMYKLRGWLGQSSILDAIHQYFHGEPIKSIFNCLWVPYDLSNIGVQASKIHIGSSDTGSIVFQNLRSLAEADIITGTIDVPIHLFPHHDNFSCCEPYTTGTLYLPGVGMVNLNMGDLIGSSVVTVQYCIEVVTGNMRYYIKTEYGNIINTYDCCVSAQCALAQTVLSGSSVMSGIMGMVGGAAAIGVGIATGGSSVALSGGALSLAMGAANTALSANRRDTATTGSIGGRMVQLHPFIFHNEYAVSTEEIGSSDYLSERGGPCRLGVLKIKTLTGPGYVQCEGASINCAASSLEKEEINNHLNNGFYYE